MKVYSVPPNYIIEVDNLIIPIGSVYIKSGIFNNETYYYVYNAHTDDLLYTTTPTSRQDFMNFFSSFGIEGGNNV